MQTADGLRNAVDAYLGSHTLSPELGGLEEALRYSLDSGGKRVRPVLCLAVAEANGASVEDALPAAAALELVHTFSLVHDDLPALDDDDERRGRPSAHVAFGEGVALLSGDALLSEAYKLALTAELEELHRLKTGRLFAAAVRIGLDVARVPEGDRAAWIAFGEDVGLLFQVVDDLLDGDGYVERLGPEGARQLADEVSGRAAGQLDSVGADTSVLRDVLDALTFRTG